MQLGAVNLEILARALKSLGWSVSLANGALRGEYGNRTLTIDRNGAQLTASTYADREGITRGILQSYGKLAATETAAKFGFTLAKATTLENGAIKLSFSRAMGPTLGKVGL